MEKRIIKVDDKEVVLDIDLMTFNESTLAKFMEGLASTYAYYGCMLADAEHIMHMLELNYEVLYSDRYKLYKDNGCTEKLSEAKSKADPDVKAAKEEFLEAKHNVRLLQQYLKAWDKAHENAQSRGHFLRKEMDKLGFGLLKEEDNLVKEFDLNNLGL